MPMRPPAFYAEHQIELRLGRRATGLDVAERKLTLDGGETLSFDALLLATGAEPVRLSIPGHDLPSVHTIRTLADSRAIMAESKGKKRVVVLGASFIGLEVAASMRARGLEVHVAAPDAPLSRVLGPELGAFVRALHEEHGVVFHIGATASEITSDTVVLSDGTRLPADLVLAGIGVRPSLALAEAAGLRVDKGVIVDEFLQTSAKGIYAAGDIARYPHGDSTLRVEHWVVAQRQGAAAARNILGQRKPFTEVPFFWSQHYDVPINYVGHAERWERIDLRGSLEKRDCIAAFRDGGKIVAVVTIGRDRASLEAEHALSRGDEATLEALVAS
jgi:NADPH-dependent 2,4-dienoyl-CoA reductase/sulfur reductase-like enzyme